MRTIRRLGSTIISSFDAIFSQIENHEAIVNSAILEVQESSAKARLHLSRVSQDGQRLRKRILELEEQIDIWQERAKKTASLDEAKALECLKRKRRLEKQAKELTEQQVEHSRLEKQLSADLSLMEDKINKLKQKRNIMKTRQSRADAMKLLNSEDYTLVNEIDVLFDRWENQVAGYEYGSNILAEQNDEIEYLFSTEEEDLSLRQELEQITKN